MILCAADALDKNKQPINELNVFPVPDGDTGTNMSLTMATAAAELRKKRPDSVDAVADCAASALLRGARGNSGVILSLLFRGIAKSLKGKSVATSEDFAKALGDGVDAAYKAVMKPAEGTILTVTRVSAASAKEFAETGSDFELMLVCALESAKDALEETVNQNPVLKRAGVVDAGGKGYVVILEAMLAFLEGRAVASAEGVSSVSDHADFSEFDTGEIEFAYDTVYIVRKTTDKSLDLLRAYLDSIGDSLVIAEDDDVFKVHVHTNIPGEALTESQKYGTLETAKIENMRTQHDELVGDTAEEETSGYAEATKEIGSVVVCAGDGMAELFRELGADSIVTGGQTMNPSTEDILKAVNATPASTVFVFPNNKNIIMAAEQCQPLTDKQVIVVPTKTIPQGVSCLISLDPEAEPEDISAAMEEIIPSVHTAQVTYAARDSDFDGHDIKAGEFLALLDGALVGSYKETDAMFAALTEGMKPIDPALVTVYYGEDVSEEDASAVAEKLQSDFPDAEVSLVNGGQPVYYYLISAE
jgi:hypothetical protein